jgi:hypothetical protein
LFKNTFQQKFNTVLLFYNVNLFREIQAGNAVHYPCYFKFYCSTLGLRFNKKKRHDSLVFMRHPGVKTQPFPFWFTSEFYLNFAYKKGLLFQLYSAFNLKLGEICRGVFYFLQKKHLIFVKFLLQDPLCRDKGFFLTNKPRIVRLFFRFCLHHKKIFFVKFQLKKFFCQLEKKPNFFYSSLQFKRYFAESFF